MNKILNYFTKGHPRSLKAKKNIAVSLVIKVADIGLGFLMVPIVLNYLGQTNYGIWLTMTSVVAWFSIVNLGLGHGLRNKFAETKAVGNDEDVKYYISTTYAILILISVSFFFLFLIANNFLNWANLLNVETITNSELSLLAVIIFGSFSFRLVIRLITTITTGDQLPAVRDAVMLVSKILVFIIIIILVKVIPGSIINVTLVYTIIPILILLILSFYLFNTKYKSYRPSFRYIKMEYTSDLFSLGWKFLIIQIGGIIMHTTDNFIISNLFNPEMVVPYQVSHKFFGLVTFFYLIILDPFWSAVTDAKAMGDLKWINSTIKKYFKVVLLFLIVLILMIVIAPKFYLIWIGNEIQVPTYLNVFWGVTIFIGMMNVTIGRYLNGMGYTLVSVFGYISIIVLNIPLSYILSIYLTGNSGGVLLATMICILIVFIIRIVQFKQLSLGKKGIWIK